VTARHAAAICCWLLAWWFAGLIIVAWLAAKAGKTAVARTELAAGITGAGGLAWAGTALW